MKRRISSQKYKTYGFVFSGILLLLLISLPFLMLSFQAEESTDTRSDAKERETQTTLVPIKSWLVTPNGKEIVYGSTPVRFFAKAAGTSDVDFIFSVDLYRGKDMQFVENLFTSDSNLERKEDIYSKSVDFSKFREGSEYKLKLTTTLATGSGNPTNSKVDFSDNFFTISSNSSKPVFTSYPNDTNLIVNENFSYRVEVKDSSKVKLNIVSKPDWLNASGNTLQGTPNTAGISTVVLVATNELGRQSSQAFSINVKNPATPTPQQPDNNPGQNNQVTPVPTEESGKDSVDGSENEGKDVVIINTPAGDVITEEDSSISIELTPEQQAKLDSLLVEISSDGVNWKKVYEGEDTQFELDLNKIDSGGEYFLRFRTRYNDGTEDIKNYGPIDIIKESDEVETDVLSIIEVQPQEGEEISTNTPTIGGTFLKSSPEIVINTDAFKIILNDEDVTSKVQNINEFGFTYTPEEPLENGEYTVRVEIATSDSEPISKEWTFTIMSEDGTNDEDSEDESALERNRGLLLILCIILFLIMILSITAYLLSRKDKQTVYTEEIYRRRE